MILRSALDFAYKHYDDIDIWIYATPDKVINLAETEPQLTDETWVSPDPSSVIRLAPYRAHMKWFDTLIHKPAHIMFKTENFNETDTIPDCNTS